MVNDARALAMALLVTTALLCGCAVQLVPPYNANIDKNASDLQKDYYVFIGNMQIQAGTPDGYYTNHVKDYTDFEARLAVIRFQAENDPGGMPCGQTMKLIQKTNGSALDRVYRQIKQWLQGVGEFDSCITILGEASGTRDGKSSPTAWRRAAIRRSPRNSVGAYSPTHLFST